MTIRKTSKVTVTITGYSDINVQDQARRHFGFDNLMPTTPPFSNSVKQHKLTVVKMLRDFEHRFHPTQGSTGLLELKEYVEKYFNIT